MLPRECSIVKKAKVISLGSKIVHRQLGFNSSSAEYDPTAEKDVIDFFVKRTHYITGRTSVTRRKVPLRMVSLEHALVGDKRGPVPVIKDGFVTKHR